jgi:hypothetical protein
MSVYAATFGHYIGDVAGFPGWIGRSLGGLVLLLLMIVNLRGVGDASGLEVLIVWAKLAVLFVLAVVGLWRWDTGSLVPTDFDGGPGTSLLAAASVFMAYEGFQLLTYDYDDIRNPERTLPRAVIISILSVIAIYVAVALGATMLTGADTMIAKQEIALAEAGRAAFGLPGLVAVSVAAAFSTASAINATLFATGRLAAQVAHDGELPGWLEDRNSAGVPDRAVILLATATLALLAIGSLRELVESASLAFLCTFACVNAIATVEFRGTRRLLAGLGGLGAGAAAIALTVQWIRENNQPALLSLAALILLSFAVRPGRPGQERESTGLGLPLDLPSRSGRQHLHFEPTGVSGCVPHALRRLHEVLFPRLEDIRHEGLRVPVEEREPAALHLHHDPMPALEGVQHILQGKFDRRSLPRDESLRELITLAETAAEDLAADHLLVAAEHDAIGRVRAVRRPVGIDIDQLHDPVRVRAGRRDLESRQNVAAEGQFLLQRFGLEFNDVGATLGEALILVHVAARREYEPDIFRVRDRLVRVAHVLRELPLSD